MKPIIFLNNKKFTDYRSNLIKLVNTKFVSSFDITDSFKYVHRNKINIFTDFNAYIQNVIRKNKLNKYGFILENIDILAQHNSFDLLNNALFVIYVTNGIKNNLENLNFKNFKVYDYIVEGELQNKKVKLVDRALLCDIEHMGNIYERLINYDDVKKVNVLISDPSLVERNQWRLDELSNLGIEYTVYYPTYEVLKNLIQESYYIDSDLPEHILEEVHHNSQCRVLTLSSLESYLKTCINSAQKHSTDKVINIVCYKPTYLFKDLVERFVRAGCIHSDFPMKDADSYIWMRPQEIWHLQYLTKGTEHAEISNTYRDDFKNYKLVPDELSLIISRSVAIHHGTCFEPLYQFCYIKLANSLRSVKKVVGVCELEECYGPSAFLANRSNFSFVPIGYDDRLFDSSLIREDTKNPKEKIRIGFVGRAYGTERRDLLTKSKLAEPYGYRKGGDIALNILLMLKALGIEYEFIILGANWDSLASKLDEFNINYKYYSRDHNISYREYPQVYRSFDLLLVTSRCEGGPVSAIEALSLGVPIVGTDVGVIQYLASLNNKPKNACHLFSYDRKWMTADCQTAVKSILEIYNSKIDYSERLEMRKMVEIFTTDNWVEAIMSEARDM